MGPRLTVRPSRRSEDEERRFGELAAQLVEKRIGSWAFICWQMLVSVFWIAWNTFGPGGLRFDGFPFIFGNLAMSAEAAFSTPIILIAGRVQQRRTDAKLAQMDTKIEHVQRDLRDALAILKELKNR